MKAVLLFTYVLLVAAATSLTIETLSFSVQQNPISAQQSTMTPPNIASGAYSVGNAYVFGLALRDSGGDPVTVASVPDDAQLRFYIAPTDAMATQADSILSTIAVSATSSSTVQLTVEFKQPLEFQVTCQVNETGTWVDCAAANWKQTIRVGAETAAGSSISASSSNSCGSSPSSPCSFVTSTPSTVLINSVDKHNNPRYAQNVNGAWIIQLTATVQGSPISVQLPCVNAASTSNRILNAGCRCSWDETLKQYTASLNFKDETAGQIVTARLTDSRQVETSTATLVVRPTIGEMDPNASCNTFCRNKGAILGGSIGGGCAVIIIAVLIYCFTCGKLSKKGNEEVEMS